MNKNKISGINLKDFKKAILAKGRVLGPVEKLLFNDAVNSTRETAHLHPSEICKKDWCPRSSFYTIMADKKEIKTDSFKKMNIFAEGHNIHNKWQTWLARCGILEGNWYCPSCGETWWEVSSPDMSCTACNYKPVVYKEVPISNEEYHLLGHSDGIIWDAEGRAVLEIKSLGLGSLRYEAPELFARFNDGTYSLDQLWKEIKTPFASHLRQINLYMFCLGITDGIILYEWKPSQDVKEFKLKFSENLISHILAGCSTVVEALKKGTPPPRPMTAGPDTKFCKECPHYNVCMVNDEDQPTVRPVSIQPSQQAGSDSTGLPRIIRRPE